MSRAFLFSNIFEIITLTDVSLAVGNFLPLVLYRVLFLKNVLHGNVAADRNRR